MEDYIIMKTGFNNAINEILNKLEDLSNYEIIEDRIKRIQKKYEFKNEYYGEIFKYYDKENNIGFIIFDDIEEIKGVQILISEKKYVEISEEECIFVKKNLPILWSDKFAYKNDAENKYKTIYFEYNHV